MRSVLLSAVAACVIAVSARSQTVKRVANLALGSSQLLVDATDGGTVVVTGVQNHLDAVSVLTLPDLQAWLDTALVVTAAHDARRRDMKWVYSVSGPALFLYRAVGVLDEEFIVGVGRAVRVSLVLSPKDAKALLEDLATAGRLSRDLTARASAGRPGGCSLSIAVALPGGTLLSPPDSSALWLDRVREQLEIRLATVTGLPNDAGRGVWFTAEADGNVTGVTQDTASSSNAVAALRDAVIYAGGWHAFRGVPGGGAVRIRASLAPRCPR